MVDRPEVDQREINRCCPTRSGWFRLCLMALLWSCALGAAAAPRIGVITMQPGEIFFERFGHNALLVADPATGSAISYNFGFFDLTEEDFIVRFVRGDMRYRLVALPLQQDLAYYRDVGRGVSLQWLDLDPAAAQEVADALEQNARPENAAYSYDYFLDNCSTRVRDTLDRALGGDLRRQMGGSRGYTFRSEATRLASPDFWMWLGFDVGLGPSADRALANWGAAFVPMRLADALRDARNGHDQPLVSEEVELLPHRLAPAPRDLPRPWWPWLLAGIVIGAGLAWLGSHRPRLVAGIALPFWTVSGLAGAMLLFIWLGTAHHFGWANQNLLLASPLAWLLLPGGWRIARGRSAGRLFHYVLLAMVALAVLALFAHWLQLQPQRNVHWIVLLLPVHWGLLSALKRR